MHAKLVVTEELPTAMDVYQQNGMVLQVRELADNPTMYVAFVDSLNDKQTDGVRIFNKYQALVQKDYDHLGT